MGQRFPFSLFGGGGSGSSASRDSTNKVYTAQVVAGSVFIVYGNGSELGRANADGTGKAIVTLANAPAAGVAISYGQVLPGGTIPTPVQALGPSTGSFTTEAAAGSLIAAITGLSAGETVTSVAPNDGRIGISGGNALVVGATASSAGSISYTLTTSTGRTLTIAVTANASSGPFTPTYLPSGTRTAAVSRAVTAPAVWPAPLMTTPAATTTPTPNGRIGSPFAYMPSVQGGTGAKTWSLASGSTLPTGVSLNTATGLLSGTATGASGNYTWALQAADASGAIGKTANITSNFSAAATGALVVTNQVPHCASNGVPYAWMPTVSAGTAPYTFSLASGSTALPAGMTVGASTGITGTPTSGAVNLTGVVLQVTDSLGATVQVAIANFIVDDGANMVRQLCRTDIVTPGRYFKIWLGNLVPGNVSKDAGPSTVTYRIGVRRVAAAASATASPVYLEDVRTTAGVTRDIVVTSTSEVAAYFDLGDPNTVDPTNYAGQSVWPTGTRIEFMMTAVYANGMGATSSPVVNWPGSPMGLFDSAELAQFGRNFSDQTLGSRTTWSGYTKSSSYAILPPLSLQAYTDAPVNAALLVGNSIGTEGANSSSVAGYIGWMQRGLTNRYPWSNAGENGLSLTAVMSSQAAFDRHVGNFIRQGYNKIFVSLFSADFGGGHTDATLTALWNQFVAKCKAINSNVECIPSTCEPRTNAANNATDPADANYGASTNGAVLWVERQKWNARVRSGSLNPRYLDQAASFEAGTTNYWVSGQGQTDGTTDGRHPNNTPQTNAANDNIPRFDTVMTQTALPFQAAA